MSSRRSTPGEQLAFPAVESGSEVDKPRVVNPEKRSPGAGNPEHPPVPQGKPEESERTIRRPESDDKEVCDTCNGSGCPQCGFRSSTPWPRAKRRTPQP